jgi:uncharacterized protein YbjT (DUF2867 family)
MIVVTGATGRVGRRVVAGLRERDLPVRAVSRTPAPLLTGADALFLLWPFTSAEQTAALAPKVAEIAARHVGRVVYLSAQPAGERPDSFWARAERAIEDSGVPWTFLRPTGFASNTLMWAEQIRAGDVVRWPFGAAARSLIDERDIAAVAVRALTQDGHAGARYLLSGPAALTQSDQLSAIGQALGRELTWAEVRRPAAQQLLAAGWGDPDFARSALDTWEKFVTQPEVVTTAVRDITGTPARSFASWAAANVAAFR